MSIEEASTNLKSARAAVKAAARAEFQAGLEELVREKTAVELARLSVELHKAFNEGATKEQLRVDSGLYRTPLFNEAWEAVPYSGRDVRPGRIGVTYAKPDEFAGGRYMLAIVENTHSELGRGVMVAARDGEGLPEVMNLPLYVLGDAIYARDLPDAEMPEWWIDMMQGGEYRNFQEEVNKLAKHEGVEA